MMLPILLDIIDSEEDKIKFQKLYYQYQNLMFWISKKYIDKQELREECVQESFLYIAKHIKDLDDDILSKRTKSYICTVVSGFSMKCYRKENKVAFCDIEEDENFDCDFKQDNKFDFYESTDLKLAIESLPEDYKNLIVMRYSLDFKLKDIAKINNTTEYYVNKKLGSALNLLREYLED